MTASTDSYIESAQRLCDTLERIGDALVSLDTATLLETEETLSRLVAVLASGRPGDNSAAIEPLVKRGREALVRCRRLGSSFGGVAKVRLQLCTGIGGYGPDGDYLEEAGNSSLEVTA
jgi:hypothetical protein